LKNSVGHDGEGDCAKGLFGEGVIVRNNYFAENGFPSIVTSSSRAERKSMAMLLHVLVAKHTSIISQAMS